MKNSIDKFYTLLPEECDDMLKEAARVYLRDRSSYKTFLRHLTNVLGMRTYFLVLNKKVGRFSDSEIYSVYKVV